jgi:hypothetical protein
VTVIAPCLRSVATNGLKYSAGQCGIAPRPTKDIPGHSPVDLNNGYDVGPWTARFIVSTVFGEKYYIKNYQTSFYGNVPGAPEDFSLRLRKTF